MTIQKSGKKKLKNCLDDRAIFKIDYTHSDGRKGELLTCVKSDGWWYTFDSLQLDPEIYLDKLLLNIQQVLYQAQKGLIALDEDILRILDLFTYAQSDLYIAFQACHSLKGREYRNIQLQIIRKAISDVTNKMTIASSIANDETSITTIDGNSPIFYDGPQFPDIGEIKYNQPKLINTTD